MKGLVIPGINMNALIVILKLIILILKKELLMMQTQAIDGLFLKKKSEEMRCYTQRIIHYIDLTNGIEDIKNLGGQNFSFIRIQSTSLEQGHLEAVLIDLDNDFLMNLALGNKCIVHDRASRKGELSRAIWYGLPWIKYVLERAWFNKKPDKVMVKTYNCIKYFDSMYNKLSISTMRKINYYKKFLFCSQIDLKYVCSKTTHDGQHSYYKNILATHLLENHE